MSGRRRQLRARTLRPWTLAWTLFTLYVVLIGLFGAAYFFVPNLLEETELTFLRSLYFSAVTITTLGYGEITPNSNLGMILTGAQAVLGVMTIGIFLSLLGLSFSQRIEARQDATIRERAALENLHKLLGYYGYLHLVIGEFAHAMMEITTPIQGEPENRRVGKQWPEEDFKFSDLRDLYGPSLFTRTSFFKPVVSVYFEKLDALVDELKLVLSSVDLSEHQNLRECIIEFLAVSKRQDMRQPLLSYETMKAGDEKIKDQVRDNIVALTKEPKLEDFQGSLLVPVILLYQTLMAQLPVVTKLVEIFETLAAEETQAPDT